MKKAMLVTLYGNYNYGNKLQNYAVYKIISQLGIEVLNVKNQRMLNYNRNFFFSYIKFLLSNIKISYSQIKNIGFKYYNIRKRNFKTFSLMIPTSKKYFNYKSLKKWDIYDYYIVGSDQVWNPYMSLDDLSLFKKFKNGKKIALSASFAVPYLTADIEKRISEDLNDFYRISVRESNGVEICKKIMKKDVNLQTLVDPTMMITREEWEKVLKKPEIDFDFSRKYILLAFLGKTDTKVIERILGYARKNNYYVIDIYEKNSIWSSCGPSEFLFLEKNASMICTDSFHSTVFALIFKTPFTVFDRLGTKENMNSRIDTLLKMFHLERCKGEKSLDSVNFDIDFSNIDNILEKERNKAHEFIKEAFKD